MDCYLTENYNILCSLNCDPISLRIKIIRVYYLKKLEILVINNYDEHVKVVLWNLKKSHVCLYIKHYSCQSRNFSSKKMYSLLIVLKATAARLICNLDNYNTRDHN